MTTYAILMILSPLFGLVISYALGLIAPVEEEECESAPAEKPETCLCTRVFNGMSAPKWGGWVEVMG